MIKTVNLQKIFKTEEVETWALNNVNLEIKAGEFVAIMGPSGCGKSTLLNILGLLDNPTEGTYELNGTDVSKFTEAQRTNLRKGVIGFVFQSFNLIDELNVFENIELPLLYMGIPAAERKRRVEDAMNRMAIAHRVKHFPQQLSGGQQQRVAIARAVVANPKLILADEPTGNLDSKNGKEVMELLTELNKEGTTIVMVTHSQHDSGYAGRTINLFDGQVVNEIKYKSIYYRGGLTTSIITKDIITMNVFLNIKLIARNWWRNKLFFLISLFSLTAGLGCTNLLMTFFIHEYNVEKYNTDRNLIYLLRQDSPMEEGIKVAYSTSDAATQIKEKYAEITDILRVNGMSGNLCKYNGTDIKQFLFISADSTLNQFFPYTTSEGSLEEVLTTPDKVAVNKRFAHQLFGNHSGIGEILEIINKEGQSKSYKVAAILEDRPQSFLHFDLLTGLSDKSWGGPVLLKLQPGASPLALQEKIKKDKIPALVPDSRYYIDPIKELYFNTGKDSKQQQLAFFQHCDVLLLYISLISALLVLIIACFNYTNLTLSRTLQQLKMIHIEKLMGAKSKEIRSQLFLDAALTVLFAFLLSLLLINDMLPWFNNLLSTRLSFSFFFSRQVLPLLLSFISSWLSFLVCISAINSLNRL